MNIQFHLRLAVALLLAASSVTLRAADPAKISQPIRVICIGDSITAGARTDAPEKESYPAQLQVLLGEGYAVTNCGVGSCTLIRKGRPNVWTTLAQIKAQQLNPDVVIINLGVNDTCGAPRKCWDHREDFAGDYRDLIKELRALPSEPQIWLCAPTPMVLETPGVTGARQKDLTARMPRLDELIDTIQELSKEQATGFIDLHTPFVDKPELFTPKDGVHPNKEGYAAIAQVIAEAIQKPAENSHNKSVNRSSD
ncbi:MAG: hypothetical protein KDA88_14170 [Planctomycetaceae bacterium]|nr:hypothetical protein [Planctomycetaceae bacterium]MCB9951991.1 hypothetical protein [Planctomycetaceae bacterium]